MAVAGNILGDVGAALVKGPVGNKARFLTAGRRDRQDV